MVPFFSGTQLFDDLIQPLALLVGPAVERGCRGDHGCFLLQLRGHGRLRVKSLQQGHKLRQAGEIRPQSFQPFGGSLADDQLAVCQIIQLVAETFCGGKILVVAEKGAKGGCGCLVFLHLGIGGNIQQGFIPESGGIPPCCAGGQLAVELEEVIEFCVDLRMCYVACSTGQAAEESEEFLARVFLCALGIQIIADGGGLNPAFICRVKRGGIVHAQFHAVGSNQRGEEAVNRGEPELTENADHFPEQAGEGSRICSGESIVALQFRAVVVQIFRVTVLLFGQPHQGCRGRQQWHRVGGFGRLACFIDGEPAENVPHAHSQFIASGVFVSLVAGTLCQRVQNTVAEFTCGLAGEGQGDDFFRPGTQDQQGDIARGQLVGLTRAGRGCNQVAGNVVPERVGFGLKCLFGHGQEGRKSGLFSESGQAEQAARVALQGECAESWCLAAPGAGVQRGERAGGELQRLG